MIDASKYFGTSASLQKPSKVTYNSVNEPIITYSTHATISGKLRPLSGEKAVMASKDSIRVDHRFYCAPFTFPDDPQNCKLIIGAETFEIKDAIDVMKMGQLMQIDLELVK